MWDKAYQLRDGVSGHHKKPTTKKFRKQNGVIAKTKKENIQAVKSHYQKVFNNHRPVYSNAVEALNRTNNGLFSVIYEDVTRRSGMPRPKKLYLPSDVQCNWHMGG